MALLLLMTCLRFLLLLTGGRVFLALIVLVIKLLVMEYIVSRNRSDIYRESYEKSALYFFSLHVIVIPRMRNETSFA